MKTDEPDFESEYLENYEGPLENCANCGREFDDIDFDYQICSYCKYDSENKEFIKKISLSREDYTKEHFTGE